MRHVTLTALAALLLAGCDLLAGAIPQAVPPVAPPADPGLAGSTFWSTAVQGRALVPGTRVVLTFNEDGTLGAGAGCNSMGGTWSLDGAGIGVAVTSMTEMGCPDDRFAQDDWLIDWLASGLTATTEGEGLILEGAGVTMTLLDREVADPDRPVEGTTWILDGIEQGVGDEGVVSSVPLGVRATLELDGGQLAVDTGCNTGAASATLDGDTLTIGPLALTKRGCEQDPSDVERAMTEVLQGAVRLEVDGRILRLTGPGGGLMFVTD
jgi:heat shock protein HslJ